MGAPPQPPRAGQAGNWKHPMFTVPWSGESFEFRTPLWYLMILIYLDGFTLWLFHIYIATENGPWCMFRQFMTIYRFTYSKWWFSVATLNYQRANAHLDTFGSWQWGTINVWHYDMKIMEWDFLQVPNHLLCKDHTFKAGFGKDRIPFSKCWFYPSIIVSWPTKSAFCGLKICSPGLTIKFTTHLLFQRSSKSGFLLEEDQDTLRFWPW